MKLSYIYIKNHKGLENINIPINSYHECSYSAEKLKLKFTPSELDYYQGLHCSAIIGKNGVGKSTILDFLEVSYRGTDSSGIIVWFDKKTDKYYICPINLYINEKEVVTKKEFIIEKNISMFIKRNKIKLIKANNLTGVESNDFTTTRKSNLFVYDMSLAQYVNGSKKVVAQRTNRLISYFNNSLSFNTSEQPKVNFNFQFSSSSTAYLKSLLSDKDFVEKNVNIENDLYNIEQIYLRNNHVNSIDLSICESIDSQLFRANLLSICNYLSKLTIIRKKHRDIFFIKLLISMFNDDVDENNISNILSSVRSDSGSSNSKDMSYIDLDAKLIYFQFNNIKNILMNIAYLISDAIKKGSMYTVDELSTFDANLIIKLTTSISVLPSLMLSNFKYGWNGFSTGEFAKLNIFSELYNYIHDQKNNDIKNHLIIMDEVDLYLHPDWQRTFFSELIEFVKVEFPEDTVQIILSTHSPIIISDFLPEDIVSLERSNGKTILVESFGFASNITDLYIEGMHLSSTFGEHSKKAINQLLTHANMGKLTKQDLLLIQKIKSKNIQDMLLDRHDKN
ncbi:AAA family ATPase [Photobacterium leiognathi]|uniref:AAA family ATPase n=1 Tax=Photobacterium leiognathi TaxID=553611 RepID=UPI0029816856|nr:AAA family ATPase [Photobacterium leiognathi]